MGRSMAEKYSHGENPQKLPFYHEKYVHFTKYSILCSHKFKQVCSQIMRQSALLVFRRSWVRALSLPIFVAVAFNLRRCKFRPDLLLILSLSAKYKIWALFRDSLWQPILFWKPSSCWFQKWQAPRLNIFSHGENPQKLPFCHEKYIHFTKYLILCTHKLKQVCSQIMWQSALLVFRRSWVRALSGSYFCGGGI